MSTHADCWIQQRVFPFSFSFAIALLLITSAANVNAQTDWPQFRGPDFNPTAENERLPDTWSTEENIEWAVKLDGRGWSSPIVVGNKVFVTTAVSEEEIKPVQAGTNYSNELWAELEKQGLSEEEIEKKVMERDFQLPDQTSLEYFLICLDLESGKELWRKSFFSGHPPGGIHRKNSFASETPTSDGQRVFAYIGNLGVYAYDLDGQPLWKQELEALPMYMEFGTGTSPVVLDDQLLIQHDNEQQGFLASYDTATGKLRWKTTRDVTPKPPMMSKSSWSTPYIWKNELRTEIITMQPGAAISYDTNGQELWRLDGCSISPASSSFAYQGNLFVNGGRGRPFVVVKPGAHGILAATSSPGNSEQPETEDTDPQPESDANAGANAELVVWKRPRTGTYIPTPVIYRDGLYIVHDNGIMQRLETSSGKQSYKQRIRERGADFTTSPWAFNGKVFFLSEQGDTYVYEAGPEGKLLHVNKLGEFTMASPAIAGDRLLIRTEKKLYSIRSSN
jgi:outer membrane protein assembly factor BamB